TCVVSRTSPIRSASRGCGGSARRASQAGTSRRSGPRDRRAAMSWEPELEEPRLRAALALAPASPPARASRVERQHAAGKLTVRERVERLLDPGTFHETGAL